MEYVSSYLRFFAQLRRNLFLIGHRLPLRLRTKLLLASTTLLAIPWVAYQAINTVETFLRQGKEATLTTTSRAVATILHEYPLPFELYDHHPKSVDLYAQLLTTPIQVDGYDEDWQNYAERAQNYTLEQQGIYKNPLASGDLHVSQLMGIYRNDLYLVFRVYDNRIIYRDPNQADPLSCDHIKISLVNKNGEFTRYVFATEAPGWLTAQSMPTQTDDENQPIWPKPDSRIKGEWQEFNGGYTVEIRIPAALFGTKMAFSITDVDDAASRVVASVVGNTEGTDSNHLGTMIYPSPELENLLRDFNDYDARIWVVDTQQRVLALSGNLRRNPDSHNVLKTSLWSDVMQWLYGFILQQPSEEFQDDLFGATRLEGQEINAALKGEPQTRWRASPDRRANILSATHPIIINGKIVGAVVVEETNNNILSLHNRAIEDLLNAGFLAFTIALAILLLFASRLSRRIVQLSLNVERAIGPSGQVHGDIAVSPVQDELGDLSRRFAAMLARLKQYTRYLETLAQKLSHELRTPLAVVKSSLENLEMANGQDLNIYTQRAKEGTQRLSAILTALSEATRLEQALQRTERITFNSVDVVKSCVEGYKMIYPNRQIILSCESTLLIIAGAPDLLCQLLDKLVSNAVDFSAMEKPIHIDLHQHAHRIVLSVQNNGPLLPEAMQERLFDSMVSIRQEKPQEPHLGLGLYVARLISEFHQGNIRGENLPDHSGVVFTVELPLIKNH